VIEELEVVEKVRVGCSEVVPCRKKRVVLSGFEWFSGFSGLKEASRQCIAMIGLVRANNRDMNI
jgi:hypothetical protein